MPAAPLQEGYQVRSYDSVKPPLYVGDIRMFPRRSKRFPGEGGSRDAGIRKRPQVRGERCEDDACCADVALRAFEELVRTSVDPVVRDVLGVIGCRDWDELRLLLHPYLHWTSSDGRTIRGRRNVLAYLAATRSAGSPTEYELRDAQIYRWTEPGGIG